MNKEEFDNLTIKEVCNYIAVMDRLVKDGIIKFNKEKAYTEFCVDDCNAYLEKQNIELKSVLDEIRAIVSKSVFKTDLVELCRMKNQIIDILDSVGGSNE